MSKTPRSLVQYLDGVDSMPQGMDLRFLVNGACLLMGWLQLQTR